MTYKPLPLVDPGYNVGKHVPAEGQYQGKCPKPVPFTGLRVLPHPKVAEIYLSFLPRRVAPPHRNAGLLPHIGEKAAEIAVEAEQGYHNPVLITQPSPKRDYPGGRGASEAG